MHFLQENTLENTNIDIVKHSVGHFITTHGVNQFAPNSFWKREGFFFFGNGVDRYFIENIQYAVFFSWQLDLSFTFLPAGTFY